MKAIIHFLKQWFQFRRTGRLGWRLAALAVFVCVGVSVPAGPLTLAPAQAAAAADTFKIYLPQVSKRYNADCRFGIAVAYGTAGYDLESLGAGSYLDWGMNAAPATPAGMAYVQEVRLKAEGLAGRLAQIPAIAHDQPGAYWLVGNEPDTTYGLAGSNEQDNLTPEIYAEYYHSAYTQIKASDPTAKVGIGGIVQPTAVRQEYMARVFTAYQAHYGSQPPSDFWHIHAFILNEVPGQWGTGMPIDHGSRPYAAAPEVIAANQNDDLTILDRRLVAFRQWLAQNGQRNKPLWITEYGVLMPSTFDPNRNYFTISIDRTRTFMVNSFTYFQTKTDAAAGLPTDGNRLVQRWYWWALSTDLRDVGGGLYDMSQPGHTKSILYDAYASSSNCH